MQINRIGIYWKARRESAPECAVRLACFFDELEKNFPLLADWFPKGESRADSSFGKTVSKFGEMDLLALVAAGANKRDIGGEQIVELGYSVGLRSPEKNGSDASISITCGLFSSNSNLSNSVVMNLPMDLHSISLGSIDSQKRLLLLLVKVWDADWGAAFSSRSDVFKQRKSNGPFFDEILWLRSEQSGPPNIIESSSRESCMAGTLYLR